MTPNPIIIREIKRLGDERLVFVDEVVHDEVRSHTLKFDEETFSELERAFAIHPFPKKSAVDNFVLFRSLDTPLEDSKKYLGLQIVNTGSRHAIRIEASEETFSAMKKILDSWVTRFNNA